MKILIVQTGFLGDVVLSTPLITALRRRFPESELSFLTTPAAAGLVTDHPALRETIIFDKRGTASGWRGLWRMAAELRRRKFDIAFSLHKSLRTAALLVLAGVPVRYGFREAAGAFLYSATAQRSDLPHDVLRNLALLRTIGAEPREQEAVLEIALPAAARERAAGLLRPYHGRPVVVIAPGSVWLTKRWLPEGFARAAAHLQTRGNQVVLVGGTDDRSVAAEIRRACPPDVLDLTGNLTLAESAAVIAAAQLLITNDSAPLHLASAFRVPVVALFCATVPEFGFGPWQTRHVILGVPGLSCRPCGRHGGNACPTGTHFCRNQLPAAEVIAAAESLLSDRPGRDAQEAAG